MRGSRTSPTSELARACSPSPRWRYGRRQSASRRTSTQSPSKSRATMRRSISVKLGHGAGELLLAVADGMDSPLLAARAPFDLIIANILAGPLIELAPDFVNALAPGGTVVLAGLLDTQADGVIAAYAEQRSKDWRCGPRLRRMAGAGLRTARAERSLARRGRLQQRVMKSPLLLAAAALLRLHSLPAAAAHRPNGKATHPPRTEGANKSEPDQPSKAFLQTERDPLDRNGDRRRPADRLRRDRGDARRPRQGLGGHGRSRSRRGQVR